MDTQQCAGGTMMTIESLRTEYDAAVANLIRTNLKANQLDIQGTVYFDEGLDITVRMMLWLPFFAFVPALPS